MSGNRNLRLVILEGDPITTQKAKVLSRLKKMGYVVRSFPHVLDYVNNNGSSTTTTATATATATATTTDPSPDASKLSKSLPSLTERDLLHHDNHNTRLSRKNGKSSRSRNNDSSAYDENDFVRDEEDEEDKYGKYDENGENDDNDGSSNLDSGSVEFEDALFDYVAHVKQQVNELVSDPSVKFKNQHVFIDASPLSIYPYLNTQSQKSCIEQMKEMTYRFAKDQFENHDRISSCKLYLCEADDIESQIRLAGHQYLYEHQDQDAQGEEKQKKTVEQLREEYVRRYRSRFNAIRTLDNEQEIVNFLHERFNQLLHEKMWFDGDVLITTDTQQATCQLLEKYLDIQFKLPPMKE